MNKKRKVNVVPHTHWDFEWYFSRYDAMIQFVHNMDEVFAALETNVLDYYLIDGQMSIIDDYLEMNPDKASLFRKYVDAGKLFIGPWYTQTDELIVAGESIIRNLQLGMKLAKKLGGYMNVGYLPDSFGQGQDMPKIYNGFNIKRALFWRGLPVDLTNNRFFNWQAMDGSNVNVLNINGGYYAGVPLIEDQTQLPEILRNIQSQDIDDIVLPLGGDQRYIDFDLKDKIKQANANFADYEFVENNYPATFSEFEQSTEKIDEISGEFIDPSVSKIHRSIYSSRYDQKYFNDKLERLITETLEPLMTMANQNGIPYKTGLLEKIWKIMARNQAHDSAGGCNSDFTNEDIISRFKEAERLVNSEIDYLTRKMSISMNDSSENDLYVYNTQSRKIKKIIELEVSTTFSQFKLLDSQKNEVPYQKIAQEDVYSGQIKRDTSQYDKDKYYYLTKILIEVEVGAFNYNKYQIVEDAQGQEIEKASTAKIIENDQLSFELLNNGQVTIVDKINNRTITDAIHFEDDGDEGDTYDYSPAHQNRLIDLDFSRSDVQVITGVHESKMILSGVWTLPADLTARANNDNNQELTYSLEVILKNNAKLLEFAMHVDNSVKDHRLRVILNSDIANTTSYADTPFGYIERKTVDDNLNDWQEKGYLEEPSAIYPMIHFVNAHNQDTSFTVFAKGIKEYEFVGDEFKNIALTMYRSVGFLGRPDLIRRPGVASGNQFRYIATPDSQLLQPLNFEFAISMTDDEFDANKTMQDFHEYSLSMPHYQMQDLNKFTNILEYFVMNKLPNAVDNFGYFETSALSVEMSSTCLTDDGSIIVRLVNYNHEIVDGGNINLVTETKYSFTDFNGENSTMTQTGSVINTGEFKPGEIKTVVIEVN